MTLLLQRREIPSYNVGCYCEVQGFPFFKYLHLWLLICSGVWEVAGLRETQSPAPPGGPWGVPRSEKMHEPSSEMWVCPHDHRWGLRHKQTSKQRPLLFNSTLSSLWLTEATPSWLRTRLWSRAPSSHRSWTPKRLHLRQKVGDTIYLFK